MKTATALQADSVCSSACGHGWLEHCPPHDGVGCFGPNVASGVGRDRHAPRDGRPIVLAEGGACSVGGEFGEKVPVGREAGRIQRIGPAPPDTRNARPKRPRHCTREVHDFSRPSGRLPDPFVKPYVTPEVIPLRYTSLPCMRPPCGRFRTWAKRTHRSARMCENPRRSQPCECNGLARADIAGGGQLGRGRKMRQHHDPDFILGIFGMAPPAL
jgi:hypothetical protein